MDRPIVYSQEQGRSVDFLFFARAAMISAGKLAGAMFGTNTIVRGLAVAASSPAALTVSVGEGEIYAIEEVDATAYGSLAADTTDMIVKQGLNMTAQTIATPAPTTGGYSINYLIEVQYQDVDSSPAVLPFFNSANPQQPLSGQNNSGAAQNTQRLGVCAIQAKAGIAASTGTQTTPAADSGWTGIAVVTVAYGQTTVTSSNISIPAGVPQITNLLQMMQTSSAEYAVDTSTTANAISLALTPAITAYTDGQKITFKAANTNTGACTINAGGGSVNLVGPVGTLQGGEIVATAQYEAVYSAATGEFVLVGQAAGPMQIAPAAKSNQAVNLSQFASSMAAAGYQKLPNGLIIQWTATTANASGVATVTWPIAFPNNCFCAVANYVAAGTGTTSSTVSASISTATTTTQGVALVQNASGGVSSASVHFIAIGN